MTSRHKNYKGSRYNIRVEWETGEVTWEPLIMKEKHSVFDTDPITVAIFACEKGLVERLAPECPGLKALAKTKKRIV